MPGDFAYDPPGGTVLNAGTNLLSVVFTPADTVNYTSATDTVSVAVAMAAPGLSWAAPPAITYGTPLDSNELNAIASVPGSFDYEPSAGTVLNAGTNVLSVVFTPTDTVDYSSASNSVILTVNMAAPVVNWPAPASIPYGAALGSNQLDATASVPGNFIYSPPADTVLSPGANTLNVLFTPMDPADYTSATDSVSLVVTVAPIPLNIEQAGANVVLSWNDPASVFALQAAPSAPGVFTNVPGATSPYTNAVAGAGQFFRLLGN